MRLLVLFILALASSALSAGGVYKWTDENGQVHFTDTPPIGKQAQPHDIKPASGGKAPQDVPGLRPGEIDKLNEVERKEQTDQRVKEISRQRSLREMEEADNRKKRDCEYARQQAKYYADKLRTGCDGHSCDYYKQQRGNYDHKAFDACR